MLRQRLEVYWNIRWLRRSIIGAAVFMLMLVAIPLALQFTIVQQLEQRGARNATLEDIDLNLFAGTFSLQNLQFSVAGAQPAQIAWVSANLDMLPLVTGEISVDEVLISGVNLVIERLDDNSIQVNGLKVSEGASAATDVENQADEPSSAIPAFAVKKIRLEHIAVEYRETDFTQPLRIVGLTIEGIDSGNPDNHASLDLDMLLGDAPLKLSSELKLFAPERHIKGKLSLAKLQFAPYRKFYRDHLTQLAGNLSFDGDFDFTVGEEISGGTNHKIEVTGLKLDYRQLNQQVEQLKLQGRSELPPGKGPQLTGNLEITKSQTRDSAQDITLAAFDDLTISDINVNPDNQAIGQIALNQIEVAVTDKTDKMLHLDNLSISKLRFQPTPAALVIEQVSLDQPLMQLTVNENKEIAQLKPILETLAGLTANQADDASNAAEDPAEPPASPFSLDIASVQLVKPGKLEFSDLSVSPAYATTIHFKELGVNAISSKSPAQFVIGLQQNAHTHIKIEGEGLLMDPTKQIAFTGKITQLDLPPVTPYTSAAMGYGMKSGVIDSDLDIKINQRELDSRITLKIDSIEVVETDAKTASEVTSASGMSIDLAVSTLKDGNNVIELELPISGNLDEPDFDLSQIINKALGKAMQSASLTYLKHALQPFGSLITLFDLVNAAANHISLPPIVFVPNSLEFAPQQEELVEKIIKVMAERPALKIKACAVSAPADTEMIRERLISKAKASAKEKKKSDAENSNPEQKTNIEISESEVQEQLKTLADKRSAKVKAYLIENGGLAPNRILNCLSGNSEVANDKPLVALEI